jgi:tape measure domain-containing protein
MARTIGDVLIRIGATTNQLEYDLKKAEKSLRASAQRMQTISTNLTVGLSVPLAAAGASALKSFASYEKLEKGLTAVMGSAEAAGKELQLLKEAAKAPGLGFEEAVRGSIRLQAVGLSAKEARKTLSTFGAAIAATGGSAQNLDSVQYQLTQMISKNRILQEDFGILQENVPLLGKAVEAAFGTANIEKIRATGISAEEFNKRIVESLQSLPEVQKATGGLGNAFDNFGDSIKFSLVELGRIIAESINLQKVLDTVAGFIENIVDGFKSLNPELQKAIVIFAGIAAAIGPVLFVTSQLNLAYGTLLINIIKVADKFKNGGFLSAFTALSGPAILAIGAVAAAIYLIYKNLETVKKSMVDVANYFIEIYNESKLVRYGIDVITKSVKFLYSIFKLSISGIIDLFKGLLKAGVIVFKGIALAIKGVLTLNYDDIKNAFANTFADLSKNSSGVLKDLKEDFKTFGEDIVTGWKKADDKIKYISLTPDAAKTDTSTTTTKTTTSGGIGRKTINLPEINPRTFDIFGAANEFVNDFIEKTQRNLASGLKISFKESSIGVFLNDLQTELDLIETKTDLGYLSGLQGDQEKIDLLKNALINLQNQGVSPLSPQFQTVIDKLNELGVSIEENVVDKITTGQQATEAFQNTLRTSLVGAFELVGETIGNAITGDIGLESFFNSVLILVADFAKEFGKQLIALGVAKLQLDSLFAAGPLGAAAAIAAGTALVAVASAVSSALSKKLPSLAVGTDMVKSDGLAMLHKGEAVVPADVVGGGFSRGGELYGRLSGIDLLLSNRYAEGYYKRLR